MLNKDILGIEEIEGIGPTTVKKFKDAGIISVMDLASADELDLAIDINISNEIAATFIMAAQKLLDERRSEQGEQKEDHSYEILDNETDFDEIDFEEHKKDSDEDMKYRNERTEDYIKDVTETKEIAPAVRKRRGLAKKETSIKLINLSQGTIKYKRSVF